MICLSLLFFKLLFHYEVNAARFGIDFAILNQVHNWNVYHLGMQASNESRVDLRSTRLLKRIGISLGVEEEEALGMEAVKRGRFLKILRTQGISTCKL